MKRKVATFNVLADSYWKNGDYSHVAPSLAVAGARIPHLLRLITSLDADVIALQEVELPLMAALNATNLWQLFWAPKASNDPDGCLMLVKHGIDTMPATVHAYRDGSGHVIQTVVVEDVPVVNTHLLYAEADQLPHPGLLQAEELLQQLGDSPAVILTDSNDRPGGPVRALLRESGFTNVCGDRPTAWVNQKPASLDLITVRGVNAKLVKPQYSPQGIPSSDCPSDHIPMMAFVSTS